MDNIDYIYASNGVGEAPRLTVTGARAAEATTLLVDSVTNVPAKFVGTSGTLNVDTGLIEPSSIKVFLAHTESGHLEIDEFAPGYEDTGNTVGQVVVIKPATVWADIIAGALGDVKDSLGGDTLVKIVVSDTQPDPDPNKQIIWFEPL